MEVAGYPMQWLLEPDSSNGQRMEPSPTTEPLLLRSCANAETPLLVPGDYLNHPLIAH